MPFLAVSGSPKIDSRKKGALVLTSLLEDLANLGSNPRAEQLLGEKNSRRFCQHRHMRSRRHVGVGIPDLSGGPFPADGVILEGALFGMVLVKGTMTIGCIRMSLDHGSFGSVLLLGTPFWGGFKGRPKGHHQNGRGKHINQFPPRES